MGDLETPPPAMGFVDENHIVPKLEASIALAHNVGLRGRTGTGKTYLVHELAKVKGKKLYTLNMTVNTTVDEVKGCYVLKPQNGGMHGEWHDGTLVRAMKEGAWLALEEANFMREELASVLYSVMDDRREIILDEHESEVVKAHPDFRLFLTMNWDYRGTVRPNDAIMNRINSWFDIPYLTEDREARLLADRTGILLPEAKYMAIFANKLRKMAKESSYPDLSTRILLNWAQLIKHGITPLEAAEQTVIPIIAFEDEEKETVRDLLNAIFKARKRGSDDD